MNPYPNRKLSHCPKCDGKMGQRTLPLLISLTPESLLVLNCKCQYCAKCDLLVGDKHRIEHSMTKSISQIAPKIVGCDYKVIGTVEKASWREGMKAPQLPSEVISKSHPFEAQFQELRMTLRGWYPDDQEPPMDVPPPSCEWVKTF